MPTALPSVFIQRAARFAQLRVCGMSEAIPTLIPAIAQNGLIGEVERSEMSQSTDVSGQHDRRKWSEAEFPPIVRRLCEVAAQLHCNSDYDLRLSHAPQFGQALQPPFRKTACYVPFFFGCQLNGRFSLSLLLANSTVTFLFRTAKSISAFRFRLF